MVFHRQIKDDLKSIRAYYKKNSGAELADEFFEEFYRKVKEADTNPKRFAVFHESKRRANMNRFPYHILYQELDCGIIVLTVRHDRRHPNFGIDRH